MEAIERKIGGAREANKVKHTERLLDMKDRITIEDCVRMTWKDFEVYVGKLYEKMGYESKKTKDGPDGGCDLILTKNGKKIVVDAKHWKQQMHVKIIGQILRAKKNYHADYGIIVGISTFTDETREEADQNKIELVDRDRLEKMLYDYPITREKKSDLISDISADDIYEEEIDYTAIIREMIAYVLQDRVKPHTYDWISADVLAIILWRKIAAKLVPKNKIEETHEKILELLKSEYEIDLVAEKEARRKAERDIESVGKIDIGVLQGRSRSEDSKLATFMEILKSLEGEPQSPVLGQTFVDELVKSEKFNEEEARNHIRRMVLDATIYESKPGHYNTVR